MHAETTAVKHRYTEADWTDFAHTGPGTLAGRYMRMFWQPVLRAQDLPPGRAKPLRIMSEDYTIYRGESGTFHLLAFRCAHRGTQLSVGWVEGDNIRCFYHGWAYDPSGQCLEQPAEPEPFCQRIKIRSYPVQEYLGLIFAYLGDGEPPPLPRYPEFEREEGRESNTYVRRHNFFNHLENDTVHTWFVHRRPGHDFRDWKGKVPVILPEESEWGITEVTSHPSGWRNVIHRGMPNVLVRKQNPEDTASPRQEHTIAWEVPVDDESHLTVQVDIALQPGEPPRPTRSPAWMDPEDLAELVLAGQLGVEDVGPPTRAISGIGDGRVTDLVKFQDAVSLRAQGRIADRTAEHLGRSDARVILFRRIWERELRALAEGRPLKQWTRPEWQVTSL